MTKAALQTGFEVVSYDLPQPPPSCTVARVPMQSTTSIEREVDRKRKKAIDRLLELRRLENDWDGEGAEAPMPELVDSAIALLKSSEFSEMLRILTRIVPINNGRIALDFHVGNTYVSARMDAPRRASAMVVESGNPTRFVSWQW